MEAFIAASMLIAGLAAGGGVAWWLRGRELAGERERAIRAEAMQAALAAELQAERLALTDAKATLAAEERSHQREIAALTEMRGEIEAKMQALAAEALKGNQASFLTLAEQVFARHKEGAEKTLEQRQKEIAALIAPISSSLEEYRKGLGEIEKARAAAYGGLSEEMKALVVMQADASTQTRRLVNALQAAPKTRGRWGEHQLRNVLELSGLKEGVDFFVERTIDAEDGRLRPDVTIRLPGDRHVVVDAKTSMMAYLDAVEAIDEETRERHLVAHARQLRTHMRQLAAKSYWDALPSTPDFVAMFIPGENFYAAAIERDPQLFEAAIDARVLIVTPTTLIALAKAVAFGWQQQKTAETTRKVHDLGRDLYRRLAVMAEHIVKLGQNLDSAAKHYNNFVGSLENRVMPAARRFNELEVPGTQASLPEPKAVETQTRLLRTGAGDGARAAEIIPLAGGERSMPGE